MGDADRGNSSLGGREEQICGHKAIPGLHLACVCIPSCSCFSPLYNVQVQHPVQDKDDRLRRTRGDKSPQSELPHYLYLSSLMGYTPRKAPWFWGCTAVLLLAEDLLLRTIWGPVPSSPPPTSHCLLRSSGAAAMLAAGSGNFSAPLPVVGEMQ